MKLLIAGIFMVALGISLPAEASPETEAHIDAITKGLLPAVVAAGRPPESLTLSDEMAALHVPGVAVAVIHDGKVEWSRGFGVTQLGGAPVTAGTIFQAGSVSKPVAATAALRLVQTGRLRLDSDVNLTLKSWKLPVNDFTAKTPVTLHHLLAHTAGTTVHGFQGYAAGETVPSVPQVLAGIAPANSAAVVVDQPVGVSYRYSGGGYTLMQLMMTDATGKTFPQILHDEVLAPISMTHSTYDQPLKDLTGLAWPYDAKGAPVPGGPHTYPEMAAAGLWTTADDLAKYVLEMQAAYQGRSDRVLSQATAKLMMTPVTEIGGLGLEIGGVGDKYFYHDGANVGYRATMVGYETRGEGAVILTNGDQGYQLGLEVLRAIAAEYKWPDFHPIARPVVDLEAAALDRFVGGFEIKDLGTFHIRRQGQGLVAEIREGILDPLRTMSASELFTTTQDIVIHFNSANDTSGGTVDAGSFHASFRRVE